MADIEKIKVGGTSYDVRDAEAAHSLNDIAVAGDNITFERKAQINYTVTGSPSISTDYVVSGFSSSNFLRSTFASTTYNTFELVVKITTGDSVSGTVFGRDSNRFVSIEYDTCSLSSTGSGYDIGSINYMIPINSTLWLKLTHDGSTYIYSVSTDGSTWNEIGSVASTEKLYRGVKPYLGGYTNSGSSTVSDPFNGSIDLTETYIKIDGEFVWRAVELNSLPSINATVPTVDQTYNSASSNAQSGVAINGAGFLKNTATGGNSLSILGNASGYSQSVNIGANSKATNYSTALGYNAQTEYTYGVAIGYEAHASGNAVCIGYPKVSINGRKGATNTNTIAIGQSTAGGSEAIAIGVATVYGSSSIAIGRATTGIGANYAIQLGNGSNKTSNTFSVGLGAQSSQNYRLLNSNGTIPGERMALQGTEAPTTATVGSVGQFYVDTTNQIGYLCVSAADSTYVWKQITA